MAEIIRYRCDKQLAAPSQGDDPLQVNPRDPRNTFQIIISAVDDEGRPGVVPVVIGSGDASGTLLYFDTNYRSIDVDEHGYIHVDTNKDGSLEVFICSQFEVMTQVLARIDNRSSAYRSLDLLFYDFGLDPAPLPAPAPQGLTNGQLTIPGWNSLAYAFNANADIVASDYDAAAIVCNDYVVIGGADMIANDFRVPYMATLPGQINRLAYVLWAGPNTISSPVVAFTTIGQGLVMPDPEKAAEYRAPSWKRGPVTELGTEDFPGNLELMITLVNGVQAGDTYDVHVYINGYDEDGVMRPPAPVQVYTLTAPKGAVSGQQMLCSVPRDVLIGYQRQGTQNWGYMWADCLITSAAWGYSRAWTRAWGPIRIDFYR